VYFGKEEKGLGILGVKGSGKDFLIMKKI